MLSDKTIRKLQSLFDCKPGDRQAILHTAGLPKRFINLIEPEGEINQVIMRISYIIDGWEEGLQEKFEKNIEHSLLFKPVEPQSNSEKWPLIKVLVFEGSISIIGVWGACSTDMLNEIERDFVEDDFYEEKKNIEVMIQVTGYCKPETEGPYITAPGYYEHHEVSREVISPSF